ncbi:alanine--glyoxylate aminotransferase family protein [Caldalkalibacillus thermarum TA2.A1]|uniref:Alanine--glyoxylate aminotransferase family protein n=1 Tax=Caldalkalibacillus thermarum (strain TA2.A1) TaxID=986075 RepID=A0A8X8I8B7_CALTT|nr:alanine--glyoxylate aminotransferase family protein [Caldalkalibacillus thermarum]QZT32600.1 alanine--glyoxylate aminotransferase family protein [Caldalkalibacillus thermarum TA2.A1]
MLPDYQLLRIPGPTPIPPSVQRAMSQPMVGHRSASFQELLSRVAPRLKPLFGTKQDVLILTGSGTLALEAAVVNALDEGEAALVLVTGAFGDRFRKMCQTYGLDTYVIESEWGRAFDVEEVENFLRQHPHIKAVFATYCETSTAVLNPIWELAKVIQQNSDALFIVDAVSCLGAVETKMDEWGIDILVTGSQKALMLPAGLAFAAISEKGWHKVQHNRRPRFYLDLSRYQQSLSDHATPFTPAVSLVMGLEQALNLIEEEGLEQVIKRHQVLKEMTRQAFKALSLPLLTSDKDASPTVTAVRPSQFKADDLRSLLRKKFGLTLAGGQQKLKGEIFRVGHMGYCSPLDVLQTIAAIEVGLKQLGMEIKLGQGTQAAEEVLIHDL